MTPLGGGSNLVLAGDLQGLVIKLDIRISSRQQADRVEVTLLPGELAPVSNGLPGPRLVRVGKSVADSRHSGCCPIQNIGAYGVELADLFVSLRAVEIASGELRTFDAEL